VGPALTSGGTTYDRDLAFNSSHANSSFLFTLEVNAIGP
jgi:hypothetical protein